MKRATRSLGFAVSGLVHAFRHERNLMLFSLGHIIVCLIFVAILQGASLASIIILSIVGGFFIVVELLNTAIERLADTFDDCEKKHRGGHYHPGIKMTKDVAASASLIALSMYAFALLVICYGMYLARVFSSLD